MKKPWQVWLVFFLSFGIVLASLSWASIALYALETRTFQNRKDAVVEERIRLALWRLDSLIGPLVTQAIIPTQTKESAKIHPPGNSVYLPHPDRENSFSLFEGSFHLPFPLPNPKGSGKQSSDSTLSGKLKKIRDLYVRAHSFDQKLALAPNAPPQRIDQTPSQYWEPQSQFSYNNSELQQRSKTYKNIQGGNRLNNFQSTTASFAIVWVAPENPDHPNPLEGMLLLREDPGPPSSLQGRYLNWEPFKKYLLAEIKDLLPEASLTPRERSDIPEVETNRLITIPVILEAGFIDFSGMDLTNPTILGLAIAWIGVLVAGGAVAFLLSGTLSLSERRGNFVSAVTHELRTPLTTFKLYTDLLASDQVQDPIKRKKYLETLRTESDRLANLVENVLIFSRLERGRRGLQVEPLTLETILDRARERLSMRAAQAGKKLSVEGGKKERDLLVMADLAVTEQILFNLVDNACKYSMQADDPTLHLEVVNQGRFALVSLRDHGPGIEPADREKIFTPFFKSSKKAADATPGVGLGLALARKLARQVGGDLYLEDSIRNGACFVLKLPKAS